MFVYQLMLEIIRFFLVKILFYDCVDFCFQNLLSLNLTNCMGLSPRAIIQCLTCLTRLRTLVLKQTKINDEVLKVIAMMLPCLTRLDLHACPVTDRGAQWLCGDEGDFDPVCRDLMLVDISATKIGLAGCGAIIRTFRALRSLSYPDSVEAVAQLRRCEASVNNKNKSSSGHQLNSRSSATSLISGQSSTSNPQTKGKAAGTSGGNLVKGDNLGLPEHHKLEILYATALRCRHVEPESVALACAHCPLVKEVYWYQDASDASLANLLALTHLCVLEVTSDRPSAVTFHEGVLPLLQAHGEQFVSLGLYDVQDLDLGLLGSLCPSLRRLKVVSMHEDADFAHSYLTTQQRSAGFQVS
jgi:hypothetical protein